MFGVTSGDGTRFCRADEGRDHDNYPEALLREGMYFLSKGSSARNRGDQSTAWDAAYAAFDRGVNRLPDFGRDDDSSDLRAKLLAGKGLALICSGLRKVGEDTIAGIPADLRRSAKSHFDAYGLPKCP